MALTTPVLYTTAAFDAADAHTFTFLVEGGQQVAANRLIIKNNETLAEVYNQKITSFSFTHTVPANTLTNGVYYQATITTYDADGNNSSPSNAIQFYCYTTPTLVLSNMPSGNIVGNSVFTFEATYDQLQDELLNSYAFTLYDTQNIQIATSGVKYVGATTPPPTKIEYTFAGLNDNTSYYIQATGQTIGGTQISSTKVLFSVKYVKPEASMQLRLENNCDGGYISLQSNFVVVDGKSNPSPPTYVKDNTAVDLTANGSYVKFDSGYSVDKDFTMSLWGYDFRQNAELFSFSDTSSNTLSIHIRPDFEVADKEYADCMVTNGTVKYYIYSDSIDTPTAANKIQIWLRRMDSIYTIELHKIS